MTRKDFKQYIAAFLSIDVEGSSRLMDEAGGICISGRVYGKIEIKPELEYAYKGELLVKNI